MNKRMSDMFRRADEAQANLDAFGRDASAAIHRLVKASYNRNNSQALTVAAALASIYNGAAARPVRLDEIRGLDWNLQWDLITVIIGTGHGTFEDFHIREAFFAAGGAHAVEWFHWRTCGGPHRAALERLLEAIPHVKALHDILLSVAAGKEVSLLCLQWLPSDLSRDLILMLDGLVGRNRGHLQFEEIKEALKKAGYTSTLPDSKCDHRASRQTSTTSEMEAMLPAPPTLIP